jgi:hypothetical protein
LPIVLRTSRCAERGFYSSWENELTRFNNASQTTETIQKYFNLKGEFGSYVADPHTAVGLCVANRVAATKYVYPRRSSSSFLT